MNLSQRALTGFLWSGIHRFGDLGVKFVVGIVLARLLAPEEFGLLAMVIVFVAIGAGLSDAGFGAAIIQRQNLKQRDLSSVFFFNIFLGLILTAVVWLSAPFIAAFYRQPELESIVRVICFAIFLTALGKVHESQLIKALRFRTALLASFPAVFISGGVGIALAFAGWGVWALVYQVLLQAGLQSIFLWLVMSWRPTIEFSSASIRSMFPYGSRLAVSGFINTVWQNVYVLVIGRLFSPVDLGFYHRAHEFKRMGAQNLSGIVDKVMFPVYSTIQDDPKRVKRVFGRSIFLLSVISFPMMGMMAGVAEPLIVTLIGEKWLPSVNYLQLLCIAGAFYPIHSANLSILKALGQSKLFLRLEIFKKILAMIVLVFTYRYGLTAIILGQVFSSIFALFLNGFYNRRLIQMQYREQAAQCMIPICVGAGVFSAAFLVSTLIPAPHLWRLLAGGAAGGLVFMGGLFIVKNLIQGEIEMLFRQIPRLGFLYKVLYAQS